MSAAEAMANGIPLVTTRQQVGSVADSNNALIADGNSAPALAAAMLRLASDAGLRRALTSAAHIAARRYRSNTVMAEYAAVYASL